MIKELKNCDPEELFAAVTLILIKKGYISIEEINQSLDELRVAHAQNISEKLLEVDA